MEQLKRVQEKATHPPEIFWSGYLFGCFLYRYGILGMSVDWKQHDEVISQCPSLYFLETLKRAYDWVCARMYFVDKL